MRVVQEDPIGQVLDAEGRLVYQPNERLVGFRELGFTILRGRVVKSPVLGGPGVVFMTNKRIVGLLHAKIVPKTYVPPPTTAESDDVFYREMVHIKRDLGARGGDAYFELPLSDIARTANRKKSIDFVAKDGVTVTFQPWGAARAFFRAYLDKARF